MKALSALSIVLTVAMVVMALSQLICGLWLQAQGTTPESVSFHASLGIGTVVVALVTITALWVLAGQRRKAQTS